jgi:ATP-dependent helicase/nuclease subunit B
VVSLPPPPKPVRPREKPETFSVTEFRAYLACPYRYYLQYVLRLESVADSQAELEPSAFGTLMHDVLQRFGRHDDAALIRTSTDPERIFGYLSDFLSTLSAARFGLKHCRPAVRVQIEQARTRLRALAEWQARRVQKGWQIVHGEETERHLITRFVLEPGAAVNLRGRIDRIDFHEETRTLAVLDYKTAEGGPKPHATHRRGDDWIDLQLPLYRHLIHAAQLPRIDCQSCRIELGYILAPKDVRQVELALAEWSAEELAAADEVARQVIRKIQAGAFDDITSPPPGFCEDLAPITQDHRLGRWCDTGEGDAT